MLDTLLIFQIVIGVLLVAAILLQKTSADGISGLGGGNMNLVGSSSATNFISKTTIILAIVFMCNAIILANLSTKKDESVSRKFKESEQQKEQTSVPIAK